MQTNGARACASRRAGETVETGGYAELLIDDRSSEMVGERMTGQEGRVVSETVDGRDGG